MLDVAAQECSRFCETAAESELKKVADCDPRWYAVFSMSRHEKHLAERCAQHQIESFLPLYSVRRRWKNRCTAIVDLPLFPNYFFVRIATQQRIEVLELPGVLAIVSSGRRMLSIPDEYIESLRGGMLAHRIEPHPNVRKGDRVVITTGPMAGMEGILVRHKNQLRVVLSVEMIGRSVAVEVNEAEISCLGAVA